MTIPLLSLTLLLGVVEGTDDGVPQSPLSMMALERGTPHHGVSLQMPKYRDDFFGHFFEKTRHELEERSFQHLNPSRLEFNRILRAEATQQEVVSGSYLVVGSLKYTVREMLIDTSLVEESEAWLRGLLEGIVGNTDEEKIEIGKGVTAQYSEESWWKRVKKNGNLKWGVRLFRWPNQYAYVSGGLGHHNGERILLWHVRYHFQELKDHRVEALLSAPLPYELRATLGIAYSTSRKYRELGQSYIGTVRIEKWLPDQRGAVFLGTDLHENSSIILGYHKSW